MPCYKLKMQDPKKLEFIAIPKNRYRSKKAAQAEAKRLRNMGWKITILKSKTCKVKQ